MLLLEKISCLWLQVRILVLLEALFAYLNHRGDIARAHKSLMETLPTIF